MDVLQNLPGIVAILALLAAGGLAVRRWSRAASKRAAGGQAGEEERERELESSAFIDTVPAAAAGEDPEPDPSPGAAPVTVATYFLPERAHLARLLLEGHGIPAFLADENLIATDWLYANAIGGVKLQVRQRDAAEAVRLLQARERGETPGASASGEARGPDADATAPDPRLASTSARAAMPTCPNCGSHEVYVVPTGRKLAYLTILLLYFPVSWLGRAYECDRCGHRWAEGARRAA